LRQHSPRGGGQRRNDSKSGMPHDGLRQGSDQMEPGGDEGGGGGSVLVASCADKGGKVEECSMASLRQNRGSGGLGIAR
jgi:hypothetical protein